MVYCITLYVGDSFAKCLHPVDSPYLLINQHWIMNQQKESDVFCALSVCSYFELICPAVLFGTFLAVQLFFHKTIWNTVTLGLEIHPYLMSYLLNSRSSKTKAFILHPKQYSFLKFRIISAHLSSCTNCQQAKIPRGSPEIANLHLDGSANSISKGQTLWKTRWNWRNL